MGNMKKHMTKDKKNGLWIKIILFGIFLLSSCVLFLVYQFNTFHTVDLELIYEKDLDPNFYDSMNSTVWYTLRSNSFNGLRVKSPEYFDNIKLDYDKYTYIVVNDHELKELKYTWKEVNLRKFVIFPDQFVGFATLGKQRTGKTYLYRIKKLNIDCDYHAIDLRNTYVDVFGLDSDDIEKAKLFGFYKFKNEQGLAAWYTLQHYKICN